MTKQIIYRAVAFNKLPVNSGEAIELAEAVFDVQDVPLSAAKHLVKLWFKAGYSTAIYAFDENGVLLGVTDRREAKSPARTSVLPDFYISTWRGTVAHGSEQKEGDHVAVFNAETHELSALTGPANDPESIEHACLFALAPRLYYALQGMLNLFALEYGPGESETIDNARRVMNSINGLNKYDV